MIVKSTYIHIVEYSGLLQYNSMAFVADLKRATDDGSFPEIAQYSPYFLPLNVLAASKGSNLYTHFADLAFNFISWLVRN